MDEWTTIRLLNRKGKGIKAIAKELKISRNTVRKALRSDVKPKYNLTKPRKSILDKYKLVIEEMLYKNKFIGSRILNELREKGYKGSDRTFYLYLQKINGKKNLDKISMPYETEPGKQCQFDWAHYTVKIAEVDTKIYIFSVILGYSRKIKFTASLSMDQSSVFVSIEEAFKYFNGVPETILMDNAKQMIDDADPNNFKWNANFYAFCGFYRVEPKACKIRTPKTKGKVEKPFQYLENHFIKGNQFSNFQDIEKKLEDFTDRVNNNYHSIIKTTPNNQFEKEKNKLIPLPDDCFHGLLLETRKVNWDLLISFKGNRYSVPYHYAGKYVWVSKIKGYYLQIYSNHGRLIASHKMPLNKGNVIKQEGHYSGISKDTPKSKGILKKEFSIHFPNHIYFLEKLLENKNGTSSRHLRGIIALRKCYSDKDIENAMTKCSLWERYSYKIVLAILRGNINSPPPEDLSNYHSKVINDKLKVVEKGVIRDLNYYNNIF